MQVHPTTVREQLIAFFKAIGVFYLFWIVLFQLSRVIFFLYHTDKLREIGFFQLIKAMGAGFPMDISATTYIFIVPLLFLFVQLWVPLSKTTKPILKWFGLFIILLVSIITFADIEVYSILGYKLNSEIITYLAHPKEAMASSESSPLVGLISSLLIFTYVGFKVFLKWVLPLLEIPLSTHTIGSSMLKMATIILTIGLAITAIRGGLGLAPMGAGHAYHAQEQVLNHGATNASWNFLYSVQKMNSDSPCAFNFMEAEQARYVADQIYQKDDQIDTVNILNRSDPNVVLVVLEGWPVDVTGSFGGENGITPFFDSIADLGIRFTNIYASGDRTFKGVPAVLSGFPAFPSGSIIQYINKMEGLPCIASSMKTKDYNTSFIYGGDIEFKSISSFITHCGFDQILSQDDFPSDLAAGSKWGVHDHHVFERAAKEIKSLKEPFLSTILTLSSHEPYDVPIPTKFEGEDVSDQFRNSVYYADWSIRQFFDQIINEPWFDNTIFVFTSDHGKPLPIKREAWEHETYHIPALIYGKPLKTMYQGVEIETIGSQLDLVKTVLDQLNVETEEYRWSRNLFDPSIAPFAFYSFEAGVGTVTPNGVMVYDKISNRPINLDINEMSDNQMKEFNRLKGILQSVCIDFDDL